MKPVRGLTILEALVVVTIIAIVAALLFPVFSKAKLAALRRGSAEKMRSLYAVFETYRNDYGGSNAVYEYYKLGFPRGRYWEYTLWYLPYSAWESPCGEKDWSMVFDTPAVRNGWISYAAAFYDPDTFRIDESGRRSGNLVEYGNYLQEYRENAVIFADPFCNPPGTKMTAPLVKKRTIAMLLSGKIVDRERAGNAWRLQFWSDPPD